MEPKTYTVLQTVNFKNWDVPYIHQQIVTEIVEDTSSNQKNDKPEIAPVETPTSDPSSSKTDSNILNLTSPQKDHDLQFSKSDKQKDLSLPSSSKHKITNRRIDFGSSSKLSTSNNNQLDVDNKNETVEGESSFCHLCNQQLYDYKSLLRHFHEHYIVNKSLPKPYQCKICHKQFPFYASLMKHIKNKKLHKRKVQNERYAFIQSIVDEISSIKTSDIIN